ncbi:MAG: 4-hydroxy-3-methylbut-2-enyl diphosphate reductase [Chloroflexi bacterium]|nr:MAG: 4-hydroxy-3-methylbut-2-enyl diphosphate reductase [Chloroflexota bacterium]
MRVILAQPRGFCAGVERAIEVVDKSIQVFGSPVFVRHEIVHNQHVVDDLRAKGAIFVDDVDEIPESAPVVFSAHGVSKAVKAKAKNRSLRAVDATCPLVTKVHRQVLRLHRLGYEILLIGHAGHPEVEGTLGQLSGGIQLVEDIEDAQRAEVSDASKVAYVTQTTLSLDDTTKIVQVLRRRFPSLQSPPTDDICYATQNRQLTVKRLAEIVDVVIVIGAANSSNSNRLVEVARSVGVPAHRVSSADELRPDWFSNKRTVGLTAGASVPEVLVTGVVNYLRDKFGANVEEDAEGTPEDVYFPMPPELRAAGAGQTQL